MAALFGPAALGARPAGVRAAVPGPLVLHGGSPRSRPTPYVATSLKMADDAALNVRRIFLRCWWRRS